MIFIVTKSIKRDELLSYEKYIDFLFINENGVHNICTTEEDIIKSNQWFNNLPVNTIVVDDGLDVNINDKFIAVVPNENLNGKILTLLSIDDDLVTVKDIYGNVLTTTTTIFNGKYFKFIRVATMTDKEKVVNGSITLKM